jgi:hypothetical protein
MAGMALYSQRSLRKALFLVGWLKILLQVPRITWRPSILFYPPNKMTQKSEKIATVQFVTTQDQKSAEALPNELTTPVFDTDLQETSFWQRVRKMKSWVRARNPCPFLHHLLTL